MPHLSGSFIFKGNPLQGPTTAKHCHFFFVVQPVKLISPHLTAQKTAQEKKLRRCNHVVCPALQVVFAASCLPHTEKSQTPTQASIISMREKLGKEMGAGSLDICPHTHSFALNTHKFKSVPSKKIFILERNYSTLSQFNPCYIFLLKEKRGGKELCRANHLAKVVCYSKEFFSELFILSMSEQVSKAAMASAECTLSL